jgi:hypothetical protein
MTFADERSPTVTLFPLDGKRLRTAADGPPTTLMWSKAAM